MTTVTTNGAHTADGHDVIRVLGARENNLKDVSLDIPSAGSRSSPGPGSGKSSPGSRRSPRSRSE